MALPAEFWAPKGQFHLYQVRRVLPDLLKAAFGVRQSPHGIL